MPGFTRPTWVALVVIAATLAVAAPARADGLMAACHWITREYLATYTCDEPVEQVETLEIVDCWMYPPSPRAFVRMQTQEGWVRNPEIEVVTSGRKGCSTPYPFRTIVRVPGGLLQEMVPLRLRLTLPRSSGVLPGGKDFESGRTTVPYAACLMPADSLDWCPRR